MRRLPWMLLRSHAREPAQALLMLLGLALSVAVVLAVDLGIDSARSAFGQSRQALSGGATHQLIGESGRIEQRWLADLRRERAVASAPIIETSLLAVASDGSGERRLRLLGIDPLSEFAFRPWLLQAGSAEAAQAGGIPAGLIGASDAVLIDSESATRLGVGPGDSLQVRIDGRPAAVQVAGVLAADALPPGAAALLIADISTAQTLLQMPGELSRIDLQIDAGRAAQVAADLPVGLRLIATTEADRDLAQMSRAFEINLQALGLLAMLVGVFVVFQSLTFLTLRRRGLIGLLRAIGVSRAEIARLLLTEALLIGLIAASLGITLGIPLAELLQQPLQRTYADLYQRGGVGDLLLSAPALAKAVALAVLGSLVAVLLPLRDALSVPPLVDLRNTAAERAGGRRLQRLGPIALLILAGGILLLINAGDSLALAFVGLFVCLLASLGLIPWALAAVLALPDRRGGTLPILRTWLLRSARAGLGRSGIALAVLSLAVATLIGMSSMIHSFRQNVTQWIERSLQAEIYVSASAPRQSLPPAWLQEVTDWPEVEAIALTRRRQLQTGDGVIDVHGVDMPPPARDSFEIMQGDADALWPGMADGGVMISEPLATRLALAPGDVLRLPTVNGELDLPVLAVYRDYANAQGAVSMDLGHYRQRFDDPLVSAAGLYAASTDVPELRERLARSLSDIPDINLVTTNEIRAITLTVFDRTFAVTDTLRLLAMLIAVVAVLGALTALALERRREFTLLRCLGLRRAEILRLQLVQALGLGLLAGMLAVPLGAGLALVLIEVINRRSFGWSMDLILPWQQIGTAVALAGFSSLLAALLPGIRMSRAPLAAQLRGAPL